MTDLKTANVSLLTFKVALEAEARQPGVLRSVLTDGGATEGHDTLHFCKGELRTKRAPGAAGIGWQGNRVVVTGVKLPSTLLSGCIGMPIGRVNECDLLDDRMTISSAWTTRNRRRDTVLTSFRLAHPRVSMYLSAYAPPRSEAFQLVKREILAGAINMHVSRYVFAREMCRQNRLLTHLLSWSQPEISAWSAAK